MLPNAKPSDNEYASLVLIALASNQAIVPTLWGLEAANVIAKAESKGWVTAARSQTFLSLLGRLNILEDKDTAIHALGDTLNLCRRTGLSAYDAAYLELALRHGIT